MSTRLKGLSLVLLLLVFADSTGQVLVESFAPRLRGLTNHLVFSETADGGILISGFIDYHNGAYSGRLIKLDANGHSFPGFNKVTGDGMITRTVPVANGKILVQGDFFSEINGVPASSLSRLNSDGSLDQSFQVQQVVYNMAVQSDGKIVIAGFGFGIARLNADGTPDNTFQTGHESASYSQLKIGDDDYIYLVTQSYEVKRLHPNGALDTSFLPVTANGYISAIEPVDNGKVIVAGGFSELNGIPVNKIARINSSGSIDQTFDIGDGPGPGYIESITERTNKNIIIGGAIYSFNNAPGTAFEISPTGELLSVIAQAYPSAT